MEIIGKVSKGSKMDQIYIPKNRAGLAIGDYVVVKPLEGKKPIEKFYFYGIKGVEPIKLGIIKDIMRIIEKNIESYGNLIVTGSFLDEGFHFNDLDLIFVAENEIKTNIVKKEIKEKTGIQAHILTLNNKSLVRGLEVDPLYQMMLSRCIVSNRLVFKAKHRVDYKLLDLHLLKSKTLIDNFDFLSGNEKYDLVRNMLAIWLYMNGKKVNKEIVDREIKKSLGLNDINKLKQNMVDKKIFLKKYKLMYDKVFAKILRGIESGAKQE